MMRSLVFLLGLTLSASALSMAGDQLVRAVEDKNSEPIQYAVAIGYVTGVVKATRAFGFFGSCPVVEAGSDIPSTIRQLVGRVYVDPEGSGTAEVALIYAKYLAENDLLVDMPEQGFCSNNFAE